MNCWYCQREQLTSRDKFEVVPIFPAWGSERYICLECLKKKLGLCKSSF